MKRPASLRTLRARDRAYAAGLAVVARWNVEHAVGTAVTFRRLDGTAVTTRTRTPAFVLPSGTPVVHLEGEVGPCELGRCEG